MSCEQVMVIASGKNYLGPQSQLRMGLDIRQSFTRHLFLASIGQEIGRIFQKDPLGAPDFDPLWTMLDTTPQGRGADWYPKLNC